MRLRYNAIPRGILLRLFLGQEEVVNTYVKLLLGLAKTSTAI